MNKSWSVQLLLPVFISILTVNPTFAARLSEYEGTIGSAKVKFTIVSQAATLQGDLPSGPITGEYFYTNYLTDIPLEGEIGDDHELTIYELDEQQKRTAMIKAKFSETDPKHHFSDKGKLGTAVILGTWSRMDGSGSLPVYLCSESDTFADIDHRYVTAGVQDDKAFEVKVRAFRAAVLAGDKAAVASMLEYPTRLTLDGKHSDVENSSELIRNYKRIFTPKFVAAIRAAVPHNMFVRYDGVMIGSGEVWFNADGKVKSLNN